MDINTIEELIKVLKGSKTEEICVRKADASVFIRKAKGTAKAGKHAAAKASKSGISAIETPATDEKVILAPMVGIFHTTDGVAKAGSEVTVGQVVGAIESMKLLNDVIADAAGTVVEVMVEDGTPVEYGQPLYRIHTA